jgi:hypothetical protein
MRWPAPSHPLNRLRRCERGAVMVEFVVTLPFLLLFLFAVVEMGRALWYHHIITNAVREGVRYQSRLPLDEPFIGQTQNIVRTGCINGGCPGRVPGWNDPESVAVEVIGFFDEPFRPPHPVRVFEVRAEVEINFWLLNFFGMDPMLTFQALDRQRHIGE